MSMGGTAGGSGGWLKPLRLTESPSPRHPLQPVANPGAPPELPAHLSLLPGAGSFATTLRPNLK